MSQFARLKLLFIFFILPFIVGGIIALLTVFVNQKFYYVFLGFSTVYSYGIIIYGIYPLFLNTEKLFHKRGYANVIFEYEFMKKLLFITIPLTIIYNILLYVPSSPIYHGAVIISTNYLTNTIYGYITLFAPINNSALLSIIIQRGKKEFRFYFAEGCCKIMSEKKDCFEKMKYLELLLRSYNKYLNRMIKVGFDVDKIYSIILYKNAEERSQILNLICRSFEADKLSLAKYLSSIYKVPDSEFYIKENLLNKIGVILATAVPILISVIALVSKKG